MEASIKSVVEAGHQVTGLIHVGANDGEEVPYYRSLGIQNIALFEPLNQAYSRAAIAYGGQPGMFLSSYGWGDKNETVEINVTENDKASSVLKTVPCDNPEEHPVFKDWNMGQWPVVGKDTIDICRYDWFVKNHSAYAPELYNTLVMDVQGMELQALEGMGSEIARFDYLLLELSLEPVYEGEASGQHVSDWLLVRGFEQITPIVPHNDVLFIRNSKLRG